MFSKNEKVPSTGFRLEKWGFESAFRATAIAFMEREQVNQVTHESGKTFTLEELKNARVGNIG